MVEEDNRELAALIRARIQEQGPLPFSEFLELVLYQPGQGYYSTSDPSLDYQSSPKVHPLFGACLARQIADFWRLMGEPSTYTVFEAGSGDGTLAADILQALAETEPDLFAAVTYILFDPAAMSRSSNLRNTLQGFGGKLRLAVEFPAPEEVEGCFLSNELLDALPFDRVRMKDGQLLEIRTSLEGDRLQDQETQPSKAVIEHIEAGGIWPAEGCIAEVGRAVPAWMSRAAAALRRGYLLTLDYGYRTAELYAPWRSRGTLQTFYRHTSGEDPYARLGHQDITASIDFSSAESAATAAGLKTFGLISQAEFLAALGIGSAVTTHPGRTDLEGFYARRRAAIELIDLSGLGRIQVLLQGKAVPERLPIGLSLTSRQTAT